MYKVKQFVRFDPARAIDQRIQLKVVARLSQKEQLVRAREDAGVTEAQLAAEFGVTQQSISNWEEGRYPIPGHHISRWAELIGVPEAVFSRWLREEQEWKLKAKQRELAKTQRDFDETRKDFTKVMGVVTQFVSQYEELGHTYRRLDETMSTLVEGMAMMTTMLGEVIQILKARDGRV